MSNRKKQVREQFRSQVFKRDGYRCAFCEETDNLDAHHITDRNEMPNGGYVLENGISLCEKHHLDAEVFHQTEGQQWVERFHPDDLYEKINSSKAIAEKASMRLSS